MDDPVSDSARAAADRLTLTAEVGQQVVTDVEAALHDAERRRPEQYLDPISLGGLIVSIATLAWTAYNDLKNRTRSQTPRQSPGKSAWSCRIRTRPVQHRSPGLERFARLPAGVERTNAITSSTWSSPRPFESRKPTLRTATADTLTQSTRRGYPGRKIAPQLNGRDHQAAGNACRNTTPAPQSKHSNPRHSPRSAGRAVGGFRTRAEHSVRTTSSQPDTTPSASVCVGQDPASALSRW